MRLVWFAVLVACSSGSSTTPPTTTPTAPPAVTIDAACEPAREKVDRLLMNEAMTAEECQCLRGRVNLSRGGGDQPHCASDETDEGPVRLGIEGGWCCKKR